MLAENGSVFELGKKYGWPGVWNVSLEASLHHFESHDAKAFEISSSFGMDGWVVAESYRLVEVLGPALSNTPLQPTAENLGS